MEFYTNISRYGNQLLYRGYKDGRRLQTKIPFSPTLFVPVEAKTDYRSLDGKYVERVKLETMREAKEFMERYRDVSNFDIYGNTNYIAQFVTEKFPGEIQFDPTIINITTIDIEVASNEGFPEPEEAKYPVISIAMKNTIDNTFYVWGLGDYDVSKSIMTDNRVVYEKCRDEHELLIKFIAHWGSPSHMPDVVTGWNIRNFDIPYLINRANRILHEDTVKKLSPWGYYREKKTDFKLHIIELTKPIVPRMLLQLERLLEKPYYIPNWQKLLVLDETTAVMLQLHAGDLGTYLNNLQANQ